MQSCGVVIKKDEMVMVCLKDMFGRVSLEGYSIDPFIGVKEGDIPEAITNNLERFFRKHKGARDNFYIALPRDSAFVCFINMPLAVEDNLRSALGYELDRYTPFSPENVYFDYHIVSRLPESALLSLMLVCIKKETIDNYIALFNKSRLKPMGIEVTTTALFNVLNFQDVTSPFNPDLIKEQILNNAYVQKFIKKRPQKRPQKQPSPSIEILVEHLNHSYEVSLVKDSMLCHSAVFPEQVKAAPDHKTVFNQEYLSEIFSNSMKCLIHIPYNETLGDQSIRINLSGFKMDRESMENTSEEMRGVFSPVKEFPFSIELGKADPNILPLLCVPIGLALKGLRKPPVDLNFIPLSIRPRKKISREKIVAAAAAFASVFLIAGIFFMTMERLDQRYKLIAVELEEMKAKASQIERLKKQAESIEIFSSTIERLSLDDISKLKILEELTRVIPDDSWLTEFEFKSDGRRVTISGFSVSASKLIPYIEESPMFEEAKFTSPITTDRGQGNMERFRIETKLSSLKEDSAGTLKASIRG